MHILHVLDHSLPLQSGYVFRTQAILQEQRNRGWQTSHITSTKHHQYAGAGDPEEVIGDFRFYRTLPGSAFADRLPFLNQLAVVRDLSRRLFSIARRTRPDILHAHSPSLNGMAALRIGGRLGIPVVYEMRAPWEDAAVDHGTTKEGSLRYRLSRTLESHVFSRADSITTICEGLRADILKRGIPSSRITVIPNAVDPDYFRIDSDRNEALAEELGLGRTTLGFVGSFYAYEGLDLLLEAARDIRERITDLKVLLVGGGPQDSYLRALRDEYELHDHVIFTGRVPNDEVQQYYNLIDIFVYPRYSMRLTEIVTPLKPLEAMAQGGLVIASDVGGHKELVRHGETGQLFAAGDRDALARSVLNLLNCRNDWHRRRVNARRFVEQERTWRHVVARYESVYAAAARNGRSNG